MRRKHMFCVTDKAKEVLTKSLGETERDPGTAVRIQTSAADPQRLECMLDQEQAGDMVVKNSDRLKVLVINSELAENLSTMVLDVHDTPDGDQLVLRAARPGA